MHHYFCYLYSIIFSLSMHYCIIGTLTVTYWISVLCSCVRVRILVFWILVYWSFWHFWNFSLFPYFFLLFFATRQPHPYKTQRTYGPECYPSLYRISGPHTHTQRTAHRVLCGYSISSTHFDIIYYNIVGRKINLILRSSSNLTLMDLNMDLNMISDSL